MIMAYRWTKDDLAHVQRKTQVDRAGVKGVGGVGQRKYKNQPVEIDGIRFDSTKEARVYQQLRIREKLGEISDLTLQVTYPLFAPVTTLALQFAQPPAIKGVCEYRCDFQFIEHGQRVVADVKGMRTKEYLLKRKWMEAQYGITIVEM